MECRQYDHHGRFVPRPLPLPLQAPSQQAACPRAVPSPSPLPGLRGGLARPHHVTSVENQLLGAFLLV